MRPGISTAVMLACAAWCAAAAPPVKPKPVPAASAAAIDAAVARGVGFLLARQEKDGSWGSPRNTKGMNIYAPVPGAHHAFVAGVTALCVSALIETGGGRDGVGEAIERGEAWLVEHLPKLRRATPRAIYNVWGHAYGIRALVRMIRRKPSDAQRRQQLQKLIRGQIDLLGRYESVNGGWGYYDTRIGSQKPSAGQTSFTTATVLVAFAEARTVGVEAPQRLVKRGVATVVRQRKPDFTYLYAEPWKWRPMGLINRPAGSLGRSQACNVALRRWGRAEVTDDVLKAWLNRLFARNMWLDIGRKRPIPHESWFHVAAYFFYYGHYYAALCIEQLPANDRPWFQDHLAHILLRLQEKDGSWWDFPFYNYHQQYGTAMALMSLHRCRKERKK